MFLSLPLKSSKCLDKSGNDKNSQKFSTETFESFFMYMGKDRIFAYFKRSIVK